MELKFKDITVCNYNKKINTSCTSHADVIVPDTQPDIYRVLCVEAISDYDECIIKKDKIIFSGNVKFNIMYTGETDKNRIYNIEYTAPFNHETDVPAIPSDCNAISKCSVMSTSYSVKNSRKLSASCVIGLEADMLKYSSVKALEEIEGSDSVPYVCDDVSFDSALVSQNHEFTVSESFIIPDGGEGFNLHSLKLRMDISEIKTVNNKAILKGSIPVKALYSCNLEPQTYETEISFTEICDLDMANGDSKVFASFDISDVNYSVDSADSTTVEFDALIKGSIRAFDTSKYTLVSRLYSPDYSYTLTEVKAEEEKFISLGHNQITVKDELSVEDLQHDISKIYYMSVYPSCSGVVSGNNCVKIQGNVQTNVIYSSTENELSSVVKNIPFECDFPADVSPENNYRFNVSVNTVNYGYILGSSREIQTRSVIKLGLSMLKPHYLNIVSDFNCDLSSPIDKSTQPSITVCYPSSDEKLWDYAVKYNTTCEEIAQVNNISPTDTLIPGKPLLIPKRCIVK